MDQIAHPFYLSFLTVVQLPDGGSNSRAEVNPTPPSCRQPPPEPDPTFAYPGGSFVR
ncbi:hypothetical protein BX666DRAFT_1943217 [Dichotomocladium elegans]|nr:hypothetical protein BX666DRAFT_1943217 [Dichotomocladium elegans]